ncbi:MAG: class I SAM-dependent methyltransferase [Candidatus Rokubacteria bacterium]|nr:class I SAM-dependent methyltransferase [Candidatus Rokubacteria bacterium]MBI3105859.1 class I SAM-dependent methyltransferase [Candidatus Rokubacteria bacterium]
MPLAYYSRSATSAFWSEHWGGHSVEELLAVAVRSPLTGLIERHLPADGRFLEAGCGLGQYVLLLRARGRAAVGADWSLEALRQGVRAGAPLAVMDLRALAVRDGAVRAYLSLGVVEHDPGGPDAIVAEAARVLAPGGTLLLSVPYWNGARRLLGPWLAREARRSRARGGDFYQFAFTRGEVCRFLEARGFQVRSFHPYDPARMLRQALRGVTRRERRLPAGVGAPVTHRPPHAPAPPPGVRAAVGRILRGLLYAPPTLRLFAHMILAVAVKPSRR